MATYRHAPAALLYACVRENAFTANKRYLIDCLPGARRTGAVTCRALACAGRHVASYAHLPLFDDDIYARRDATGHNSAGLSSASFMSFDDDGERAAQVTARLAISFELATAAFCRTMAVDGRYDALDIIRRHTPPSF